VEDAARAFLDQDEVASLAQLQEKLDRTCLPKGIIEVQEDDEVCFLAFARDATAGPQVSFSLIISDKLEMTMYSRGVKIPLEQVAHITGLTTVSKCSEVLNILSFLKSFTEAPRPKNDTLRYC
jgi:hypothetical protein